ncbi:lachesin isoform X2 [Anoplophora glabripennis]|uniref:lachesin isoform X2 n=1 Tax=Anoplophora glabripennis TaxID=217634 RepID=UPI0008752D03|nr:lachesin isoform X2 [Anoplophora glabripennis]
MRLVLVVLFSLLFATVNSKPDTFEDTYGDAVDDENKNIQNDDYDDYANREETPDVGDEVVERNEVTPEFRTKPQIFVARIGEVIRLPCEITNQDMVLVWRKDDSELLYQGDIAMKQFPNVKKTSEGLEVNVTSDRDYGKYTCQMMVSEDSSPKITHMVVPPTPPVINSIRTPNNNTEFSIGGTLELQCIATGNPKPKISWHKDGKRIEPTGENITIPNLKPHNAGLYVCLADNNVLKPAHKHIEIFIEHKPVVTIDKYLINSNHEEDVELKCIVHAYPVPVVSWKKGGMNIKEDPPKVMLKRHQNNVENLLIISNLTEADFGEYTCSASNKFGKVDKTVGLVKVPVVQGFVKPEKTNKDVVLTWKVQSKPPVTEHSFQYRKKGEEDWKNIKPEVSYDEQNDTYTIKGTLKGLEPGSYETRARSRNTHGWSSYSDIMPFEGVLAKHSSHHKPHHKKHPKGKDVREKQAVPTTQVTPAQHQENEASVEEEQVVSATHVTHAQHQENETVVGASQRSGCATALSSIYLTSIALLALCCRQ